MPSRTVSAAFLAAVVVLIGVSVQMNSGGDTAVADSVLSTEVSRLSTRVSTLEAAMIPKQEDPMQGTNWMDYLSVNGLELMCDIRSGNGLGNDAWSGDPVANGRVTLNCVRPYGE